MDDDSSTSSSSVSFEDIGPRGHRYEDKGYRFEGNTIEQRTVNRLKELVAKSTAEGTKDIIDGSSEVPDVLYTLQYKGRFGARTTERT